jgi:hypothetical protein
MDLREECWFFLLSCKLCARELFSAKPHSQKKSSFRPRVEALEDLIAPTAFTWNPAANAVTANWADGNNWQGGDGTNYPQTASDAAIFDGNVRNVTAVLPNSDVSIGQIQTKNNFNKDIQLSKTLILSNQQALGDSSIDSPVRIVPTTTTGNLTLDGVRLYVYQGTIGPSNASLAPSTLEVKNGGDLEVTMRVSVVIGMNIALGNVPDATMVVKDVTPGYNNVNLGLANNANISVEAGAQLKLYGSDGDGRIEESGTGDITLSGKLWRAGSGEVKVDLPILVKVGGELKVFSGALNVTSTGVANTNNHSIDVEAGGQITMGDTLGRDTTGLIVASDILLDGGTLLVRGGPVVIQANYVEFTNGATLVSNEDAGIFTNLTFNLTGQNAQVKLTNGQFKLNVGGTEYNGQCDTITVNNGKLNISATNTTLQITLIGTAYPAGENYYIILADSIPTNFATFLGTNLTESLNTGSPYEFIKLTTT